MTRSRAFLTLAMLLTLGFGLAGCGGNPDQTGAGDKGIGPAGTNGTDLPQTPEEQLKRQQEEDAAFRKNYRPK